MLALASIAAAASFLPLQTPVVVAGEAGRALDAYLSTCEVYGFSGVVLVERAGERVLAKGYGVADALEGTPNTPDTLYDIASITKQVTAAAILLLEARGELSVDDRLVDRLPGVPADLRDVTLAHLLHHTAGFPRSGPAGTGDDREAAMATYLGGKRSARAGKRFEYWNGGYAVLAAVVETVSGRPFEQFVREELFRPAGLARTDFIETAGADVGPLARSLDTHELTTDYIKGWGYRGMGGMLTSAVELRDWCDALFGGRVLPEPQLEWMLTPDRETYAGGWYVFETERGRPVVQHGGTASGFDSYVRWFPEDEALIVVLCNRGGWCWQVTWGLSELLLDELSKAPRPPEPARWKDDELASWLGAWSSVDGERLLVERAGVGVRLTTLGGAPATLMGRGPDAGERPAKPTLDAAARARVESRALRIVEELRAARNETLRADMAAHLPPPWPDIVRDRVWPAHVARWGALREAQCLGSIEAREGALVEVWIRLAHERGTCNLLITYVDGALAGLDLKAVPKPFEARAAPVGDELVAFDFRQDPPFRATLSGRGERARLVLRARSGAKLELKREAPKGR